MGVSRGWWRGGIFVRGLWCVEFLMAIELVLLCIMGVTAIIVILSKVILE